jgi:S1-C subfamily serine protease
VAGARCLSARLVAGAMLALAALLLASCIDASREEKSRAFAPYRQVVVDGEPLAEHARSRTVLLLAGFDPRPVEFTAGGGMRFRQDHDGYRSFAAIVSADGYLVTAAHCAAHGDLLFACVQQGETRLCLPARVVWKGADRDATSDWAVLRIDAQNLACFAWGEIGEVPADTLEGDVSGVGSAIACTCLGRTGGHLIGIARGPEADTLLHDMPTARGDSGSPLVDLAGRLLGVDARWVWAWHGYEGEAVRPHPARVAEIIAADRQRTSVGY